MVGYNRRKRMWWVAVLGFELRLTADSVQLVRSGDYVFTISF